MSAANVKLEMLDSLDPVAGKEQTFGFNCPRRKGKRCDGLIIAGRTNLPRDPQSKNGGIAQWDMKGPTTFSPSVNCGHCGWHGFVENNRCVDVKKQDEPEPK